LTRRESLKTSESNTERINNIDSIDAFGVFCGSRAFRNESHIFKHFMCSFLFRSP